MVSIRSWLFLDNSRDRHLREMLKGSESRLDRSVVNRAELINPLWYESYQCFPSILERIQTLHISKDPLDRSRWLGSPITLYRAVLYVNVPWC